MKTNREEARAVWIEHLKQWRQSGRSRLEYCRERGVKDHQLRYWAGRLSAAGKPNRLSFVKAVTAPSPLPSISGSARLFLPTGSVIEFSAATDPAWIVRVAQEVAR